MAEKKADHEHKEIKDLQKLLRFMLGDAKYEKLLEQAKK
jgi:hypothetical protein